MRKRLLICTLFLIFLFPAISHAYYVGTNNGVYKFMNKVLKCEMYNSTTEAWVTLWDYTSDTANSPVVDLGAGSVSSQMGTYMSGISIPIGTYTQMRVTFGTILTMRGWVKSGSTSGSTYYYTDVSDTTYQSGSQDSVPSDATCTEITLNPPPGSGLPTTMVDTETIGGGGLTVTEGGSFGISIIIPMEQVLTIMSAGPDDYIIVPYDFTPTITPQ